MSIETRFEGNRITVAVSDTGIGIDPSQHDRIFERFVQVDGSTSREFAGTGLGLSLAKELVELHGGQMHLDSELGQGSRFWFELPLMAIEETPVEAAPQSADISRGRAASPICDPSRGRSRLRPRRAKRLRLPRLASTRSWSSTTARRCAPCWETSCARSTMLCSARDGQEGWEAAQRERPDVIISDVMMPHVDGREFCRRVKEDAVDWRRSPSSCSPPRPR